jgi:hypothetical protein
MEYEIYSFRIFLTLNGKKRSNLYSNNQIHILTIKFKFKRINRQHLTTAYQPQQWAVVRMVPSGR